MSIESYTNFSRWGEVSAASKINKLTGKSPKEITCDKLKKLIVDHPEAAIRVLKALLNFKMARQGFGLSKNETLQAEHLTQTNQTLQQIPNYDSKLYPTIDELEILVKNSSSLFQRKIPTHFKQLLCQLDHNLKTKITDDNNKEFLQANGIFEPASPGTRLIEFTKIDSSPHLAPLATSQSAQQENNELYFSFASSHDTEETLYSISTISSFSAASTVQAMPSPQRLRTVPSTLSCAINEPRPINKAKRQELRNDYITEVIQPYTKIINLRLQDTNQPLSTPSQDLYYNLNSLFQEIGGAINIFNSNDWGRSLSLARAATKINDQFSNLINKLQDHNLPLMERGYVATLLVQLCLIGFSPFSKFNLFRIFDHSFANLWTRVLGKLEYKEALKQESELGQLRWFTYVPYSKFMLTSQNPKKNKYTLLMQIITEAIAARDENIAHATQAGNYSLHFIQNGAQSDPLALDPLTFHEFNTLKVGVDIFELTTNYSNTSNMDESEAHKAFKNFYIEAAAAAAEHDWHNRT